MPPETCRTIQKFLRQTGAPAIIGGMSEILALIAGIGTATKAATEFAKAFSEGKLDNAETDDHGHLVEKVINCYAKDR